MTTQESGMLRPLFSPQRNVEIQIKMSIHSILWLEATTRDGMHTAGFELLLNTSTIRKDWMDQLRFIVENPDGSMIELTPDPSQKQYAQFEFFDQEKKRGPEPDHRCHAWTTRKDKPVGVQDKAKVWVFVGDLYVTGTTDNRHQSKRAKGYKWPASPW